MDQRDGWRSSWSEATGRQEARGGQLSDHAINDERQTDSQRRGEREERRRGGEEERRRGGEEEKEGGEERER
ncbi:hypothetical protein NHX12_013719, partial [Muraenolepis orangiensis]